MPGSFLCNWLQETVRIARRLAAVCPFPSHVARFHCACHGHWFESSISKAKYVLLTVCPSILNNALPLLAIRLMIQAPDDTLLVIIEEFDGFGMLHRYCFFTLLAICKPLTSGFEGKPAHLFMVGNVSSSKAKILMDNIFCCY